MTKAVKPLPMPAQLVCNTFPISTALVPRLRVLRPHLRWMKGQPQQDQEQQQQQEQGQGQEQQQEQEQEQQQEQQQPKITFTAETAPRTPAWCRQRVYGRHPRVAATAS